MPRRLAVREMSAEEEGKLRELARSRIAPARLVQRARVVVTLLDEPSLGASQAGRRAGYENDASGRTWIKRFNEQGLGGLTDEARSGRPVIHTEAVRIKLISLAVQKPRSLAYPFELWTVERLQAAFKEREGLHLAASTIWEWLTAEGLQWKRQQSWFHDAEKHDPEFVEKRGP
jgi:transposase